MSKVQVKITLKPSQMKKISTGSGSVRLQLLKGQLVDGEHTIVVNSRLAKKIAKHRAQGKGIVLDLTPKMIKDTQQLGGLLPALGAVALPALSFLTKIGLDSAGKSLKADSAGKRKINRRLEYLRGNGMEGSGAEGNGADSAKSDAWKKGHECACQYGDGLLQMLYKGKSKTDLKKMIKQPKVQQELLQLFRSLMPMPLVGNGISGDGALGDFIDGFKFGFANPFEAVELLGRELDHSLSRPKKKKKKGGEINGSGIAFY